MATDPSCLRDMNLLVLFLPLLYHPQQTVLLEVELCLSPTNILRPQRLYQGITFSILHLVHTPELD